MARNHIKELPATTKKVAPLPFHSLFLNPYFTWCCALFDRFVFRAKAHFVQYLHYTLKRQSKVHKSIQPYLILLYAIWITCWLILMLALPAAADIYTHIDRQGVIHFTNAPLSNDYQIYIKKRHSLAVKKIDNNRFDLYIEEAASLYGLEFNLLKAVIRAESAFNPKAISNKGALGLMQIMPGNLERFRVYEAFDPWQNVMGGARYLKALLHRFDGDVPLALAAYNAGPQAVTIHQGIPPFQETEEYVKKVMEFFNLYKEEIAGVVKP